MSINYIYMLIYNYILNYINYMYNVNVDEDVQIQIEIRFR